jgi:hypothetical protein
MSDWSSAVFGYKQSFNNSQSSFTSFSEHLYPVIWYPFFN